MRPRSIANRWSALLAAALATAAPASAHHSIAAAYDGGKRLTLDASVVEFHFVNPHPFLVVDVLADARKVQPPVDSFELAGIVGQHLQQGRTDIGQAAQA